MAKRADVIVFLGGPADGEVQRVYAPEMARMGMRDSQDRARWEFRRGMGNYQPYHCTHFCTKQNAYVFVMCNVTDGSCEHLVG